MKVPTHDVSVIAEFAGAGVSQSVFSFDSPLARMGVVEVIGTEGTLIVPDPNLFTGEVKITRAPDVEDIAEGRLEASPSQALAPAAGSASSTWPARSAPVASHGLR